MAGPAPGVIGSSTVAITSPACERERTTNWCDGASRWSVGCLDRGRLITGRSCDSGRRIREFRPHIDWSICQVTPRALAQNECPPGAAECNLRTPIKASPEDWFMPGDNRGESDDSRFGTRSSILDHRHRAMVLARRGPARGVVSSSRSNRDRPHRALWSRRRRVFPRRRMEAKR